MTAPRYSYLLCDLLTDRKIAALPLQGVTFGRRIGYAETMSGTLVCPDAQTVALAKIVRANTTRSALYVYRDGALWGGGIVWDTPAVRTARGNISMTVTASTFESYAFHRDIREDITYAGVDQGVIVADLWRRMQDTPAGDIGVVAVDQPTGILRDRIYLDSDATRFGQRITELADVVDGGPGPEWTIDVQADPSTGVRTKTLRIGAPLNDGADFAVTFEGSAVESWAENTDGTTGGTSFRTRGAAPEGDASVPQEPLMSNAHEADDLLARGWPQLDRTDDYSDVSVPETLEAYAEGLRQREAGAPTTSAYTVNVEGTTWQPNLLGQPVRIKQNNLWTGGKTVSRIVRPVGFKVTAASRGVSERVELIFDDEES